jgi:hypothetical protein
VTTEYDPVSRGAASMPIDAVTAASVVTLIAAVVMTSFSSPTGLYSV